LVPALKHQDDDIVIDVCGIHARLSAEHIQVVRLIARGYTYAQIGHELAVCRNTVCDRVRDVKNRLGMDSRIQVVLALRDAGLLD
jgi:DNA-binding NarL/FixJ family response regulator